MMMALRRLKRKLIKTFGGELSPASVEVLTGYAQWARNYPPQAHNPLMAIEQQAMLSLLPPDLRGKTCLDLACGTGRYLALLQARRAAPVFGADYSADMLAQATRLKSRIPDPKLVRSPFLALPFANETFDLITCGLAVGHERNLNRTLAEAARVLRPGGSILYSDFHPFGSMAGWQRTFRSDNGALFKLEHHLHLYSDHHQACQQARLMIETVLEPLGGKHGPAESQNCPLVLVIRAVKTEAGNRGRVTTDDPSSTTVF